MKEFSEDSSLLIKLLSSELFTNCRNSGIIYLVVLPRNGGNYG